MNRQSPSHPNRRARTGAILDASRLLLHALLRYRLASSLPLVAILLLIAYAGMVLSLVSPMLLLGVAQATPFLYPLF